MITFLLSIVLLVGGYFIYGAIVERLFGADPKRATPAQEMSDGVDYVPMGWGKIFLIQFLNIAGLGPIFGAIMGAVYGPVAFLWIVFGSIFGGAVHDYLSGMMSVRHKGVSLPELGGLCLGNVFRQLMRGFAVLLMILVGAVFIAGPSKLLAGLTPEVMNYTFWCIAIFLYYVLATMLPIDKVIGRIYPVFGFALLFMAVGIGTMIIFHGAPVPEAIPANLHNMHPKADSFPIFPMLFISIACGAVSGFHATQSPLMARCLRNEKHGRRVFYGAMIAEGIVALIWAAAAMSFFGNVGGLQQFLADNDNNAAVAVDHIARSWLGQVGGLLAIIGVIAAPITSGDTAFRSARLIVADFLRYPQKPLLNRAWVAIPLFVAGFAILQMNFDVLWRYFAWANQTLAAATLWTVAVYLAREKKCFWIAFFPAVFMTAVVATYIVVAPEGLRLSPATGYITGDCITAAIAAWFLKSVRR
ncbi:MAG: carbon starvation protein A [Tannerellaceae bacterium]|jgi:carbon starvation protein CstA|nr:carbon starvation protein A [Tannerellaceae bacterium]